MLLDRRKKLQWAFPPLHLIWLVILAFLTQLAVFYLPATRMLFPDRWVSTGLVYSRILLLVFCWLNRPLAGIWLLAIGLALNLLVIAANGGLMPINLQTASRFVPQEKLQKVPLDSRFGYGKDRLISTGRHPPRLAFGSLPASGGVS